jgi:hypothetical protein
MATIQRKIVPLTVRSPMGHENSDHAEVMSSGGQPVASWAKGYEPTASVIDHSAAVGAIVRNTHVPDPTTGR